MGVKGAPFKRGRYETLDYIITSNEWKSKVKNVNNHTDNTIETRHYPLMADISTEVRWNREGEGQKESMKDIKNAMNIRKKNTEKNEKRSSKNR